MMGRKDWIVMRSSSWNGWRRSLVFFLLVLFILINLFYVLELHQNPAVEAPQKKIKHEIRSFSSWACCWSRLA
ncbi:hypothetical protein OIU76_005960 [Salix suchowensis]|nr:hypothetical protein OIU76_005960 [Salix suchowensis]